MPEEPYPDEKTDKRKLVPTATPGIYKRGGRYVVRYRDPSGRDRKRSCQTLAEARDVKAELRADVARGEYRARSRITFAEYAETWIASYQGRTSTGIRAETRADYAHDLGLGKDGKPRLGTDGRQVGAVGFFGRMRLGEITPPDVKGYAAGLAGRGLAPNTVRLYLSPLRALLATAFEEGLIRSNPAAGVRIAQRVDDSAEPKAKALTEEELARLLAETPPEWRLLVEFLADTGLRIGEAVALQWGDLDLGKRRVRVRRRLYQGRFAPPKSRYGVRDVPLSQGMTQALWNARKEAGDPGDEAPLFATSAGTHLSPSNVAGRVFKPAARRAGVEWASFHTLRHTAASRFFRAGLNPKQVQVILGHHSPAFTMATYIHLLPDDLPDTGFLDQLRAARPGQGDEEVEDGLGEREQEIR